VYDEAALMMLQTLAVSRGALPGRSASPSFVSLYDEATAAMHLLLERDEPQSGGGGSARDALSRLGSAARKGPKA
jgi:hypothetical protein